MEGHDAGIYATAEELFEIVSNIKEPYDLIVFIENLATVLGL
jgi:hypothetical protein